MSAPPMTQAEVTRLLEAVNAGTDGAHDELIPVVYEELRRLAVRYMGMERKGHTLEPTALVHEAFMKLVDQRRVEWSGRAHFFGIAAQAMRRILVDHARRRKAQRRGGGVENVTLVTDMARTLDDPLDVLAVDDALRELAEIDPRAAQAVELRFFAGMSVEEAARVMDVSPVTVKRDWRSAKAWLYRRLDGAEAGQDQGGPDDDR